MHFKKCIWKITKSQISITPGVSLKTGSGIKESSAPLEGHGHLVLQNLYSFFNLALFWFLL